MGPISILTAAVVAGLRNNADLVEALGGSDQAIFGYTDLDQNYANAQQAMQEQPDGTVMVIYRGFSQGFEGVRPAWKHSFQISIKAASEDEDTPAAAGYFRILDALMAAPLPDGPPYYTLQWPNAEFHEDYLAPDQITLQPALDADKIEFWILTFTATEKGA